MLGEREKRRRRICQEGPHFGLPGSQQFGNLRRGTVTQPNPDDFGRRAVEKAELMEVGILGSNRVPMSYGEFPNNRIVCPGQPNFPNMAASWIGVSQKAGEPGREILVEQEGHAAG